MNAKPKYEVGQTVLLFSQRQKPRQVTVARVGRKNVYAVVYGREYGFNMDTGVEVGTHTGVPDCIRTFEQRAERERRDTVTAALREHGITNTGYGDFKQDTDTLERLLAVLDDHSGRVT